jgi:hypothetical protein
MMMIPELSTHFITVEAFVIAGSKGPDSKVKSNAAVMYNGYTTLHCLRYLSM